MTAPSEANGICFERQGVGEPLLLIPGTGSRRQIWVPIVESLAPLFDTIAIDLPGCGDSPLLGGEPSLEDFAMAIEGLLDELGIEGSHIVGNSFGGWLALELAKRDRALSLSLLSPTGLWGRSMPLWARATFRMSQLAGRLLRPAVPPLAQTAWGRTAFTFQAFGRPWSIDPEDLTDDVLNLIHSPGVEPLYQAARQRAFVDGQGLRIPVSIAFGTRDISLPRRAHRQIGELPSDLRCFALPGCGHVPMYDDPDAIIRVIRETTARAAVPEVEPVLA